MSELPLPLHEVPIGEILPNWIRNEQHVVYPEINCVVVEPEKYDGSRDQLAITSKGLLTFPQAFTSYADFNAYLAEIGRNSQRLLNSDFLRIPSKYPGTIYKLDIYNKGIETLMTLEWLAKRLLKETGSYVFKPIENYWALPDIQHMEKVDARETKVGSPEHAIVMKGKIKLSEDAQNSELAISVHSNDRLYRGLDPSGLPIITLVDINDPEILAKLHP